MKRLFMGFIITGVFFMYVGITFAKNEMIVFPKEGQSREVQAKDSAGCEAWAKEETGVDPSYVKAKIEMSYEMVYREAQGSQQSFGGRLLKGAARGAALGAVGKNVDNDVGKRALQGGMFAGMRGRDQKKQAAQDQKVQNQESRLRSLEAEYAKYLRGFTACMEAKGYSVK